MFDHRQYSRGYFMPPVECNDWVKKEYIDKAPMWCSVDLRDGNQALIEPMSLEEKLEFFNMLLKIGFKHIEVGFPAASETEYEFLRTLIEKNMIPDDVTIQVLTQAREHIIKKTFEAISGAKNAVVHVYNSVSKNQREQVFKKSMEDIKKIADTYQEFVDGTMEDVKGFCAAVDMEEIEKQDYILTPGRYVGIEEQEDDGEPFEEKMTRLTTELSELFAKSHELEDEIRKKLGAIGYEI